MRKIVQIVAVILLIVGVIVIAYPYIEQYRYAQEADKMMKEHKENINKNSNELIELYDLMKQYNTDIYDNGQIGLNDPFSYEEPTIDLQQWGLDDNIVCFIYIPAMNVKLPVYLGATEDSLTKGAAHLSQTSMPIGGNNTNAVIAAHRGYYKAAMFRDIEDLELGDKVYVSNYWDTLVYEVVNVEVIEPDETNRIYIQENRDLITLITCHPKWVDNKRYVVYCERIDN